MSSPGVDGARHFSAGALLTRLVTGGLVVVAIAVIVSATEPGTHAGHRAEVAADNRPVLAPEATPGTVGIRGAERMGDVIALRVDPAGGAGARTLVLAPGATVTGGRALTGGDVPGVVPVARLLDLVDDARGAAALRPLRFRLSYDALGQVDALTQVGG
jgi:hypothetical protein